jgi:hypothetical protein
MNTEVKQASAKPEGLFEKARDEFFGTGTKIIEQKVSPVESLKTPSDSPGLQNAEN